MPTFLDEDLGDAPRPDFSNYAQTPYTLLPGVIFRSTLRTPASDYDVGDTVRFAMTEGTTYHLDLWATGGMRDFKVEIYDATGFLAGSVIVPEGTSSAFSYTAPATGDFYIAITSYWFTQAGGVNLVVNPAPDPLTPPDGATLGTTGADSLSFGSGDDVFFGLGGGDRVNGGNGDDSITTGAGRDRLHGGGGDDVLQSGDDLDVVIGFTGNDTLLLEGGNDRGYGHSGNDLINGGTGDDLIYGGAGDDDLSGDAGNDSILGEAGNDLVYGGAGDDYLDSGHGNDTIEGGSGNDVLRSGAGDDWIRGQDGDDSVWAFTGNDIILMDHGNDFARGQDGDDFVGGGEGNDRLFGDAGNDTVQGGGGDDTLTGGAGADTFLIDSDLGTDIITDFAAEDVLFIGWLVVELLDVPDGLALPDFLDPGRYSQDGNDLLIFNEFGGTVRIQNTAIEDLTSDNFFRPESFVL